MKIIFDLKLTRLNIRYIYIVLTLLLKEIFKKLILKNPQLLIYIY